MALPVVPNNLQEPLQSQSAPSATYQTAQVLGSTPAAAGHVVGAQVAQAQPVRVPVMVPSDIAPGQQLAFTAPDGQKVIVTVADGASAGTTILVQYEPLQPAATMPPLAAAPAAAAAPAMAVPAAGPALPAPTVLVTAEEDQRLARERWWIFGFSFVLCFCWALPITWLAPVIWICLASAYYCQSPERRQLMPQQRRLAQASLIACCAVVFLAFLVAVVGGALVIGGVISQSGHPSYVPHGHHGHHGEPNLSSFFVDGTSVPPPPQQPVALDTDDVAESGTLVAASPPGAFKGFALARTSMTLDWGVTSEDIPETMVAVAPQINTTLMI